MNRDKTFDYLKAFSIVLVLFYHGLFSANLSWSSLPYICTVIALKNVHVPMFILIAGYLCRKQDIKSFYLKKVKRILIPFLFMSCLKLICSFLITSKYAHEGSVAYQLYDAFICGGLYWYCYCLLVIFALAPLIWNSKALKWTVTIVFTAVNLVLFYTGTELTDILQITQVVYFIPVFTAGMLLRDYNVFEKLKSMKAAVICLIAALAVGAVCGYLRFRIDVNNIYLIDIFMGYSIMYILYFAARFIKENAFGKTLSIAGKYSFQIMLLDSIYRVVLFEVIGRFAEAGLVSVFASTIIVLILSCLTCAAVKRVPVLNTLMGLKK